MQQLADRKPEIAISHAGVLFLLEDMGVKLSRPQHHSGHGNSEQARAPGVEGKQTSATMFQKAPPPSTSAFAASKTTPRRALMAPPPLPVRPTRPDNTHAMQQGAKTYNNNAEPADPLLFADPLFRREVSNYMQLGQMQPPRRPVKYKFSAPYNPVDDDLLVWKQRLAQHPDSAHAKKDDNKAKEEQALQEKERKSDEDRVTEIHDMGNDMTPGGECGGAMLGFKPLEAYMEEGHSGVQQETEMENA
jgi:hypothetical protein